ncbi:RNA-directed DNA polymerase, eukaryota [Tanacetum coccineum]|uniref:RNA-directed DNA polymerase, eukaryota n=1 Tax=Tanacetum coccineum TaxID=301880 RepID=A0ABQ5FZV1_9ASTR
MLVTNFLDHVTASDLWKVCNNYGVVVDAFIRYKKSKAGKRFAFVRFIKVDNIDRLVTNLGTIWIRHFHLHANVHRFHRERKSSAPSHPSNADERNSSGNDSYESESFDNEEDAEDDGLQFGDKVIADNDVERVSESIGNSSFDYALSSSLGNSGGILCVWEPTLFVKDNVTSSDNFLAVMGTWVPSSSKLLIISVYAPQDLTEKKVLWDYILHLIDRWDGDCVIMGDFNKVRTEQERYGSVFNVQGANAFNSFISLASLIDLPLDGYAYTWAHKTANKMSKLDRFLVSKGLLASFPYLSALCFDRNLSGHCPILMQELSIDYIPTPFSFFHS